jgi:hypothetical protein
MFSNTGKTLTIFVILIIIVLASSTSIGFFLYHKESDMRRSAQSELDEGRATETKLQTQLKEAQKRLTVLEDKNKEADDKINNLMDEAELNKGLHNALKTENASLKEALETAKKEKEKITADLQGTDKKYQEAAGLLKAQQDKTQILTKRVAELEDAGKKADAKIAAMKAELMPYNDRTPDQQIAGEVVPPGGTPGGTPRASKNKVELDKIVVNPNGTRGKILSVDKDAEFVVCSLGLKQGIKAEDVLSVYRGEEYLGDVKVSRVQQDMSAADIVPPFSSRKVRKNDIVVFRP